MHVCHFDADAEEVGIDACWGGGDAGGDGEEGEGGVGPGDGHCGCVRVGDGR